MVAQSAHVVPKHSLPEMEKISCKLSREIIEITTEAGSGHPSSSLSAIDLMTVLYFGGIMRYDPQFPDWPERDRFILSKGHAAPALYVTLAQAGYFGAELLPTLRELGSPLEGHPNRSLLPGVEASTGSLGQGLSIGLGHALAARLEPFNYHVYAMIGDGESDEGQIWEAAMAAAKFGVDNLTCILDLNDFQQTGSVEKVMPTLFPVAEKWRAFDWDVREIDGHDLKEIHAALLAVQQVKGKPQVIVAHTKKGKGLSPFEKDNVNRKHGVVLKPEEAKIAIAELERMCAPEQGG